VSSDVVRGDLDMQHILRVVRFSWLFAGLVGTGQIVDS
jgi:hypothetical protein